MANDNAQIEAWRNEFGDSYIGRNPASIENIRRRTNAFAEIFLHLRGAKPTSILEVGCNIGINLRALKNLTSAKLHALEPNPNAREVLTQDNVLEEGRLKEGMGTSIPFDDESMDLVFTSGVLIHVPPADLDQVYKEIHRVSGKYILCAEYFSQKPETIPYRGRDDLLFKQDFGGLWLDTFPDLEVMATGFFWKRTTGLDDLTWWLFRKP